MKIYSYFLPYLLLVSFYTGTLEEFDTKKIEAINNSPYQGVAVPLVGAYDTRPIIFERFSPSVTRIKETSRKHIWPWVFFNRFIGGQGGGRPSSYQGASSYFQQIRGADLYNETGALADFYLLWRQALRLARELRAPGIIVDPEAYNNYQAYKVSYLAQQSNRNPEEVCGRLRDIGANLADIVIEEYPQAILWFLFTGLITPPRNALPGEERSVTHIIHGLLRQAKKRRASFILVSGGELSAGYCYRSLPDLIQIYQTRQERYSRLLAAYPHLRLGGTIAPWLRLEDKKDWLLRNRCGQSTLTTAADFIPLIGHLLRNYGYVWIYAASAGGYNPYDSKAADIFNRVLEAALAAR